MKSIARTYDDLGRVVTVTSYENNDGTGSVRNQVKYTYNYLGKVSQIDQDHADAVGSAYAIYHWHPFYVDALACRMRAADTHYFLHDANYNVTAAVEDSTNNVAERYAYSPYGEVTVFWRRLFGRGIRP